MLQLGADHGADAGASRHMPAEHPQADYFKEPEQAANY